MKFSYQFLFLSLSSTSVQSLCFRKCLLLFCCLILISISEPVASNVFLFLSIFAIFTPSKHYFSLLSLLLFIRLSCLNVMEIRNNETVKFKLQILNRNYRLLDLIKKLLFIFLYCSYNVPAFMFICSPSFDLSVFSIFSFSQENSKSVEIVSMSLFQPFRYNCFNPHEIILVLLCAVES